MSGGNQKEIIIVIVSQYLKPTKQKPEANLDDSEFEDYGQEIAYFSAQENAIRNYYL